MQFAIWQITRAIVDKSKLENSIGEFAQPRKLDPVRGATTERNLVSDMTRTWELEAS